MKKTAIALLLACSFLGAGCSDSTVETTAVPAAATATPPAPEPTLTAEQQAQENAAMDRKRAANGLPVESTAAPLQTTPAP
jgi:hypothetical protein